MADNDQMRSIYDALQLNSSSEIRLMRVIPNPTESIVCELRVVKLLHKPQYMALSYTWGPSTNEEAARGMVSTPTHPIHCNGHSILVTENLYAFFVRISKNGQLNPQYLWVDSICINQNDPQERSDQVNLMATIYNSADNVLVWLGEEDETTKKAFDFIKLLSRRNLEFLKKITPKAIFVEETTEMAPYRDISFWDAVKKLFQRNYFTRAWIIQEIVLAKTILVFCGRYSADWDDIVKVSQFLTLTPWTRWISAGDNIQAQNHAIPNILAANQEALNVKDGNILLYSIIRARRFVASDPRDKVYALLGVAGSSVTTGKSRLYPVYGERSVAETYTNVAIQILEDMDDLLLLTCAEGDEFKNIPMLPSWVPDWSCTRLVGLGVTGYRRYAAAGNLLRTLTIDEKNLSLMVKGFKLDDVVSIGESKSEVLRGSFFPQWLSILESLPQVYHTGQSRSEVFWRTLLTDTAGVPARHPASCEYGFGFVSWIKPRLADYVNNRTQNVEELTHPEAYNETTAVDGSSRLPIPSDMLSLFHQNYLPRLNDHIGADEYEATLSHSKHLRVFSTSRGYLGVGSESMLEKDSVWIIAGCRVPIIIREVSLSVFRVVGGAYVHGFMKGEALEGDYSLCDITIV